MASPAVSALPSIALLSMDENQRPNDNGHPFRHVLTTRFKIRVVRELLGKETTGRLLDLGCGAGYVLWRIGRSFDRRYGVDVDRRALALGAKHVDAVFAVADAQHLPYSDGSFRTVLSTDAFEHIPDDGRAMREIRRVLEPGGSCVIYTPSIEGLLSETRLAHLFHDNDDFMLDQRTYTLAALVRLVEDADMVVEHQGYHNVFMQEACTQILKGMAALVGKDYRHQGQIENLTDSMFFKIYRWTVFPVAAILIRLEEIILSALFGQTIRGHRVFVKCRRPEPS
jgi:ubiquinone/menaquinone biosynthesis C-methylase UbiE